MSEPTPKIAPFIKCPGGKRKIAPAIVEHLVRAAGTRQISTYVEPFLGGGAVFWELYNQGLIGPETDAHLSDTNDALVRVWSALQFDAPAFVDALRELEGCNTPDDYYRIRDEVNDARERCAPLPLEIAARIWFLNRTGFNGLWRQNRQGRLNVPYGRYKTYKPDYANLLAAGRALASCRLHLNRLDYCLGIALPASAHARRSRRDPLWIYCDPPYRGTFTSYSQGGFDDADQTDLAQRLTEAATNGHVVVASNTLAADELYDNRHWQHHRLLAHRNNINRNGKGRAPVPDALYVAGPHA